MSDTPGAAASDGRLIDLDAVLAEDIQVQIDGDKWPLPGDAPSEILLKILLLSETLENVAKENDAGRILEVREQITEKVDELFALRTDPEDFPSQRLVRGEEGEEGAEYEPTMGLSDARVGALVSSLFEVYYTLPEGAAEAAEEGGARPTGSSTQPKPKSTKRSARKSSGRKPAARRRSPAAASAS